MEMIFVKKPYSRNVFFFKHLYFEEDIWHVKPYIYQVAGRRFDSTLGSLRTGIQSYFYLFVYTTFQKRYVVSTEGQVILNSNICFSQRPFS